jgi:hypothetical protein
MEILFKSYDNSHISYVDAEGEIGVTKKQYTFHKRKRKALDFDVSMLRWTNYCLNNPFAMLELLFVIP